MLRILVELCPFGDVSFKREIGNISIINDGTNKRRPEYGNYIIRLLNESEYNGTILESSIKIKNHKRSDGWLELLHKTTGELLKIAKKSKDKEFQNT